MFNSLDPDQARPFVNLYISADKKKRIKKKIKVKQLKHIFITFFGGGGGGGGGDE